MRADPRFTDKDLTFWAYVRAVTQSLPNSSRGKDRVVLAYDASDIFTAVLDNDYPVAVLGTPENPSPLLGSLVEYFAYRADLLNNQVKSDLMTVTEAREEFNELCKAVGAGDGEPVLDSKNTKIVARRYVVDGINVRVAMNKQKGEKRNIQYFTGMIDLLMAHALRQQFDEDPHQLTAIGDSERLQATLSRRMDGAFPSVRNPKAIWEIKEYYYTTTFGSKISDAVYVSELDGYELQDVKHFASAPEIILMVDSYGTWWEQGRSYLCRLIDILNMGKVDEIMFGREIFRRIPVVAEEWLND